jgi:hypothetical protein
MDSATALAISNEKWKMENESDRKAFSIFHLSFIISHCRETDLFHDDK